MSAPKAKAIAETWLKVMLCSRTSSHTSFRVFGSPCWSHYTTLHQQPWPTALQNSCEKWQSKWAKYNVRADVFIENMDLWQPLWLLSFYVILTRLNILVFEFATQIQSVATVWLASSRCSYIKGTWNTITHTVKECFWGQTQTSELKNAYLLQMQRTTNTKRSQGGSLTGNQKCSNGRMMRTKDDSGRDSPRLAGE